MSYKAFVGACALYSIADSGTGAFYSSNVFVNNSSLSSNLGSMEAAQDGNNLFFSNIVTSCTENTANAEAIKFTFNVASTDRVTPKAFLVELLQ